MIPYSRQCVDENDIQAVVDVLRSDWLTTGPAVTTFEQSIASFVQADHAVAVCSGTAALHCAMYALGIGPGDEVIVPPITFAATANCICYRGAIPVFADVDPNTLLIDPKQVEQKITPHTKAIIGVDYAGQPCDWDQLRKIATHHGIALVADGCHALGAEYKNKKVGTLADLTVFSFHPVKHITTGEGGMIVTDNDDYAAKMRLFRNHGISSDARQREKTGSWFYELVDLGYNYRISDIQCALGTSQLRKLPKWIRDRRKIAANYDRFFADNNLAQPLHASQNVRHAYHLYVIRVSHRDAVFSQLRANGIGVNVHYVPVHLHPFYKKRFGTSEGLCPVAEKASFEILSLPIYQGLSETIQRRLCTVLENVLGRSNR